VNPHVHLLINLPADIWDGYVIRLEVNLIHQKEAVAAEAALYPA
jgi:hypothetical protein